MDQPETTAVAKKKPQQGSGSVQDSMPEPAGDQRPRRRAQGGFFAPYKPEQGKVTRRCTFGGAALLIAWGGWYVNERLSGYQGDEVWNLLITPGIAFAVLIVFLTVAWRYSFANVKTGDFMVATEGEMKKVSWSSRREVIGSTKVVILFTFLMAALLFVVDLMFQGLFQWLGVLKA